MLMKSPNRTSSSRRKFKDPNADEDAISTALSVDEILLIVRRQWLIVLVAALIALVAGAAYVFTATPVYTSTAEVVISGASESAIADIGGAKVETVKDDDILTYIELIRSDRIIARALTKTEFDLNVRESLARQYEQRGESDRDGLFDRFTAAFAQEDSTASIPTPTRAADSKVWMASGEPEVWIVRQVKDNMSARRIGRTNVISVSYDDVDPARAHAIVEAIATSFVEDHAEKKVKNAADSVVWLQNRIAELKQKVLATDTAVQKFRSEHGLLETNGRLVTEQALTQTNEQLLAAEAETARVRSQYERIKDIIESGDTKAVITDALDSSLINQLRAKYLEASKFEAEIESRLGASHEQAIKLRKEMHEYSRLMFEELQRIRDSISNELAVAESRENKLRSAVQQAAGAAGESNQVMVQLRELDRESEVYRSMYESLLQRLQEMNQQAELPVVVAEIVNRPEMPDRPSKPNKALILGLSLILGIGAGAVGGALRELRDVSYKNGEQLGNDLDMRFLGYAPIIRRLTRKQQRKRSRRDDDGPRNSHEAEEVGEGWKASTDDTAAVGDKSMEEINKEVRFVDETVTYILKQPLSQFSETIRSCRLATEREAEKNGAQVIGVISALPGEGKTTISTNLAMSFAEAGHKTLLIDADLRRPGLTKHIGRSNEGGLFEVLRKTTALDDALLVEPTTKLHVLPCFASSAAPSDRALDHRLMGPLIEALRDKYEYVILDLPPLAPVIDARSLASEVDGFIYVVEWGVTSRKVVHTIVDGEQEIFEKCRGIVLNKTNLDRMKYYAYYGSVEYYRHAYADYNDYVTND